MSVLHGVGLGLAFTNPNSTCNFHSNTRFFPQSLASVPEFHPISLRSRALLSENGDDSKFDAMSTSTPTTTDPKKSSGTSARSRRLLKLREEKRKREHDRLHNYPAWAKVLEDACKNDAELRAVLGDSIGNPEEMRKKLNMVLTVGDLESSSFNPLDSYIWFELIGSPTDRDVDLIGSIIQSWYVMGRLGAFNSSNLQSRTVGVTLAHLIWSRCCRSILPILVCVAFTHQLVSLDVGEMVREEEEDAREKEKNVWMLERNLANSSMEYNPVYDADKGFKVMQSSFHDISDVEFQDNWGRVWVDLGTSDYFAIDVLLNCLTVLSSEYLGIQQVVFGGRRMGDWEEGMTSPEYGYKSFKI
uniref:Uncharacterized protein n=1 Tax=Cucumis melo TaxID=3656 RepID=A0A9I9D1P9_CUCME